jgi:hypothetical protein
MEILTQTLRCTHDWALDRIEYLSNVYLHNEAEAIQSEFNEWLNPNILDHEIYLLEYLGEN